MTLPIIGYMNSRTHIPRIAAFVLMSALAVAPQFARADAPVLMILEHVENKQPVETKIETTEGPTTSPLRGKAIEKIKVRAGDGLSGGPQPNDVTVEFSRGADTEAATVLAIAIRYFRDKRGVWIPHYQLIEDIFVVRGPDGQWKPLSTARGMPSLIVMTGTSLPNPEGFFPALEFGLTNGTFQIDSWTIKK